jgi:hypothetical protein
VEQGAHALNISQYHLLKLLQIADFLQYERFLSAFDHLISSPLSGPNEVDIDSAFAEALPSFLSCPNALNILATILRRRQLTALPKLTLEAIQNPEVSLSTAAVRFLVEIIQEGANHYLWVQQILENTSSLREPAEQWIIRNLQKEDRSVVIVAYIQLHKSLVQRQRYPVQNLEDALVSRVIELMMTTDVPLDVRQIYWLLSLEREPLTDCSAN